MNTSTIHVCDVLRGLARLPDESVHCVATSPPYWSLRDYGVEGQIGLEETPEEWCAVLVNVFRQVRRVLRYDGTLWLNLGDSYAGSGRSGGDPENGTLSHRGKTNKPAARGVGLKGKDLVGQPWLLAFALRYDGWYLRSEIIWHKPNPMPESVTDRPTKSHEHLFLLSKSPRYFYDSLAVREPLTGEGKMRRKDGGPTPKERANGAGYNEPGRGMTGNIKLEDRNLRDVWSVNSHSFPGAHFATFPPKLVEPCIAAGTSQHGVCKECGKPWTRVVETEALPEEDREARLKRWGANAGGGYNGKDRKDYAAARAESPSEVKSRILAKAGTRTVTKGWKPACECGADVVPAIVLDPFAGAGTTGLVATGMGRDFVGIELSREYAEMARRRIAEARPLWVSSSLK